MVEDELPLCQKSVSHVWYHWFACNVFPWILPYVTTFLSSIASSAKDTTSSSVVSSDTQSAKSTPTSEEVLDEFLVIPQTAIKVPMKRKKKFAINDLACCITDLEVLEELRKSSRRS